MQAVAPLSLSNWDPAPEELDSIMSRSTCIDGPMSMSVLNSQPAAMQMANEESAFAHLAEH
jgi:hypothetical protein